MGEFDYLGKPVDYIDSRTEYKNLTAADICARLIYSEAYSESYLGKQGVFWVCANRILLDIAEFGHTTWEVCTNPSNSFDGMKTSLAHRPDQSSQAWYDSCRISITNSGNVNPIGKCLWFNKNDFFNSNSYTYGGYTYYKFPGSTVYQKLVEKVVIGNHTFFRVEGSRYEF